MKRRVLFLLYSLCEGGAQRVLTDAVNALSQDETLEITVHTLFHDETYARLLARRVRYCTVFRLRPGFLRKLVSGAVQYLLPPGLVYRLFFADDYDVEVAFLEGFPTKILAYSNNRHAKKLAWVHIDLNAYAKHDRLYFSQAQQARCYWQFDKICCVSADVREAFVQKFGLPERACVVYNVLDDDAVRAKSLLPCAELPAGGPLLVSLGSLTARKGYARLLRICGRLKREGLAFRLLILGEGEQRRELETLLQKEGLAGMAFLPGFAANPYPLLARASLYICPSFAEGYSTAVYEALLLGVPVVAARCAGMRELLGESEYGLITQNSEQALYEGIHSLLCQPELLAYYREKAALRGKQFSMQKQLREYKKLLLEDGLQ